MSVASSQPIFQSGDRISRAEFERRWDASPDVKNAELIEGVVHIPAAALRWFHHGRPHRKLAGWIDHYIKKTPGVDGGDHTSVRQDDFNMAQPDLSLIILPEHGGQARISADDYLEVGLDLAMEISVSTTALDLNQRFDRYRAHSVREYLVWRVAEKTVHWFSFVVERVESLEADPQGIIKSRAFSGLWLGVDELVRGTVADLSHVLRRGIKSPEHALFVQQLTDAYRGP